MASLVLITTKCVCVFVCVCVCVCACVSVSVYEVVLIRLGIYLFVNKTRGCGSPKFFIHTL